jgi:hypothetical protein
MTSPVCPCCGHPIPSDRAAARLVGKQRKLYEIIKAAGTEGIPTSAVIAELYDDDPAGGPESPNIICVMTRLINYRIERYGIAIKGQSGPGSFFRLVTLPDDDGGRP